MTDTKVEPCTYCGADVRERVEPCSEQGVTTPLVRRTCTNPDCVTRTPGSIVTP